MPKQRLIEARPQLVAVQNAAVALGLQPHELLHAGPPLADPTRPPETLRSSIVMSCLHEGWAADEAAAEALLQRGGLRLMPAQDHACVTPLAAIVSPSTPLCGVGDAAGGTARCHAPLSAVRGVDTRMGFRDPGLLARLRQRDQAIAPALQQALDAQGPIPLWPLAALGLAAGDDLHGSTAQANQALATLLRGRGAAALADDVAATPLFFLTLWMAASALILRAAEGGDRPTLVTRAGGNGECFGVALAGRPDQWTKAEATPPTGPRLPSIDGDLPIEGAIGDSAVIDMLGLGAQRLAHAPELRAVFERHAACALDLEAAPPERLLALAQPLLADGWALGLDAARVVELDQPPRVMLAMLGRDGRSGLCGRGLYTPPLELFVRALQVAPL